MRKVLLLTMVFILLQGVSSVSAQDDLPGSIAYIGTDYNVYTFAGGESVALTDDANVENRYVYQLPTWAPGGRLAYFSRGRSADEPQLGVYVSPDGVRGGERVYETNGNVLNYAYWSPEDCGENCRDLALLLSDETGLFVELLRTGEGEVEAEMIGRGGPFYYSWSPDGAQMLWQRNMQRLDVYDVAEAGVVRTLTQQPGIFQAPMWSPIDDRLLVGALNANQTDLVVVDGEQTLTLAAELRGLVAFAWSPDGRYVAYTANYGVLNVVDARSGALVARTLDVGVFAFFWSPDSSTLAYVTLARERDTFSAKRLQQDANPHNLLWSVLNVQNGQLRAYAQFFPTSELLYLLSYFDQFAQSHRLWSPDSRYLLYSEETAEGVTLITVLDTQLGEAQTIAEGVIGIWSFE